MQPMACPICDLKTIDRIFENVTLSAKVNGDRTVGGIVAYRCTVYDHIFFVRASDVEQPGDPLKRDPVA